MAGDDDLAFDFEAALEPGDAPEQEFEPPRNVTAEEVGQQPANFIKNYRQTVCTYWLRGLCMKGDSCGFLHRFDPARMPVCRTLIKTGRCDDLDCPYKHSLDDVKECNMYKLGFCIYGATCRYKHTKQPGPPPDPAGVEGAKPKEFRDRSAFMDDDRPDRGRGRGRPALAGGPQPLALPVPGASSQERQQQRFPRQGQARQGQGYGQGQAYGAPSEAQQPQAYGGPAAAAAMFAAAARAQQHGVQQQQQQQYGGGGGGSGSRPKGVPAGVQLHPQGGGGFLPWGAPPPSQG